MFLRRRFYLLLLAVALVAGLGYAYAPLFTVGRLLTLALFLATIADIALLWHRRAITAERLLSTRFSNGDDNPVTINVESTYPFPVRIEVIDELPFQFQQRSDTSHFSLLTSHLSFDSSLRPTRRGVYSFGHVLVYAAVPPPATSASIPRSSVCTSTS